MRVGWRKNNKWLSYDSYTFSTNALPGHLPDWYSHSGRAGGYSFLFSRL
ncbi:MAG: hypothetical protein HEQ13_12535 [Dolichospermum sp. DEX189]|nr:hypothetical protein [Dolichospermum sp. DEX189]